MRVAKAVTGFALLLAGVVMLFVPGPGWLTIAGGLAVLAKDFPWAHRWLEAIKRTAVSARDRLFPEKKVRP